VAIDICYICAHNHPKSPAEQAVSYDDCQRCKQPTCSKHGRAKDADHFYCIRCLHVLGLE